VDVVKVIAVADLGFGLLSYFAAAVALVETITAETVSAATVFSGFLSCFASVVVEMVSVSETTAAKNGKRKMRAAIWSPALPCAK